MYLASDGSIKDGHESRLILDGVSRQYFEGSLFYYKLFRSDFWIVSGLNALTLSDHKGNMAPICSTTKCQVVFDSGTSWITGPESILGAIKNATNPNLNCSNIDTLPTLSFTIGQKTWTLSAKDYTTVAFIPALNATFCQSGFQTAPDASYSNLLKNTIILGDSFLRKHYIHYDMENIRVGVALARRNNNKVIMSV
jgi:hypothetical protein